MAGLVNDSMGLAYLGSVDLSAKKGYLVTLALSGGVIKAGLATASSVVDGYVEVGKVAADYSTINRLRDGDRVSLAVPATHGAIAIGDVITATAGGAVIETPTDAGTYNVIGIAESALAENVEGFVTVRVNRRSVTVSA